MLTLLCELTLILMAIFVAANWSASAGFLHDKLLGLLMGVRQVQCSSLPMLAAFTETHDPARMQRAKATPCRSRLARCTGRAMASGAISRRRSNGFGSQPIRISKSMN